METLKRLYNQLREDVKEVFGDQILAKSEREKDYEYALEVQRARENAPWNKIKEIKEDNTPFNTFMQGDILDDNQRSLYTSNIFLTNDDPAETIFDVTDYI